VSESQDPIGALLRSAGPPLVPDAARMDRAMQAVHGEWRAVLESRRHTKRRWLAAAAASVMLLIGLVVAYRPAAPAVIAATVTRVQGEVLVNAQPVSLRQIVVTRQDIDTGQGGRVLLELASGARIRVDSGSLVQWASPTELNLTRGRIYAETAQVTGAPPLVVTTPLGVVRHVGTRFEVQLSGGEVRVRVREGAVDFERESRPSLRVAMGQQLSVTQGDAVLEAGPGSADDQWAWTGEISPRFVIEGQRLTAALDWLSHETGFAVVYRDEQARSQASAIILRGSIDGLDTRDALRVVLAGSGLEFLLAPGHVEIGASRGE
jgi:ferric-dicitrate binding protein FerR (iron transport regulator)